MQLATGSYTGNGVDDRSIAGVGFQPDLVVVKGDIDKLAVFSTSTMDAGDAAYFAYGVANIVNAIQALEADGFQVGTSQVVNDNGTTYYYAAFRDNGAGDFHVGTYTGDGNDDRSITGVGFQPTIVWIKRDGTGGGVWRVAENAGDATLSLASSALAADKIQALEADGFQVGTHADVNVDTAVYHYVAFKDAASFIETGSYAGDGNDDRSITVGFSPDLVFIKSQANVRYAVLTFDTMDAGDSSRFTAATPTTNKIQALEANGFQVGTDSDVNLNGQDHYWAAWKVGTTGAVAAALPILSSRAIHSLVFGGVTVR